MCFLMDTICEKHICYRDQDLSRIQSQQTESVVYAYSSVCVCGGGGGGGDVRERGGGLQQMFPEK